MSASAPCTRTMYIMQSTIFEGSSLYNRVYRSATGLVSGFCTWRGVFVTRSCWQHGYADGS